MLQNYTKYLNKDAFRSIKKINSGFILYCARLIVPLQHESGCKAPDIGFDTVGYLPADATAGWTAYPSRAGFIQRMPPMRQPSASCRTYQQSRCCSPRLRALPVQDVAGAGGSNHKHLSFHPGRPAPLRSGRPAGCLHECGQPPLASTPKLYINNFSQG